MKKEDEKVLSGMVMEVSGASFVVITDAGTEYRCRTFPGTKTENGDTTLVAVGDRVELKIIETGTALHEAAITFVLPRRTALTRKRDVRRNRSKEKVQVIAANIDQLVIVVSAFEPLLNTRLIDRYLVFAESEQMESVIVVNKMDLDDSSETRELMAPYHALGYRIIYTSAEEEHGMEELEEALAGKLSAFSGHSGVGKSTLINQLSGQQDRLRTGETNVKTGKGLHTTTNAVMLALPCGVILLIRPAYASSIFPILPATISAFILKNFFHLCSSVLTHHALIRLSQTVQLCKRSSPVVLIPTVLRVTLHCTKALTDFLSRTIMTNDYHD